MSVKEIAIPILESLKKADVVKFNKCYEEYCRDIEAANRAKSPQQRTNLRNISECVVDQELLDEIVGKLGLEEKLFDFLRQILTRESFDAQKIHLAEGLKKSF